MGRKPMKNVRVPLRAIDEAIGEGKRLMRIIAESDPDDDVLRERFGGMISEEQWRTIQRCRALLAERA